MSLLDAWDNTAPTTKTIGETLNTAFSNTVPASGLLDPSPLHVACATTGNVTLASFQPHNDTCDGVTPDNGALVLVRAQTDAAENGVYVVGTAPMTRYGRLDSAAELAKLPVVIVDAGTTLAGKHYQLTGDSPFTPATSHLHWTEVTAAKMTA